MNARRTLTRTFYFFVNPLRRAYWFVVRPETRGVKCIIENDGKFLLTRLGYAHKSYTIPGGGVGKKETWEDAAIREVFEETGLRLKDVKKIGEYKNTKEYKRDTVCVYYSEASSSKFAIDGIEVVEAGWFSASELPKNHVPRVEKLLGMLEEWKVNQK